MPDNERQTLTVRMGNRQYKMLNEIAKAGSDGVSLAEWRHYNQVTARSLGVRKWVYMKIGHRHQTEDKRVRFYLSDEGLRVLRNWMAVDINRHLANYSITTFFQLPKDVTERPVRRRLQRVS